MSIGVPSIAFQILYVKPVPITGEHKPIHLYLETMSESLPQMGQKIIVDDTRDILSAVVARISGFLSSPHFGGSTCGQTVPDPITKAANYHGLTASNQNASADAG